MLPTLGVGRLTESPLQVLSGIANLRLAYLETYRIHTKINVNQCVTLLISTESAQSGSPSLTRREGAGGGVEKAHHHDPVPDKPYKFPVYLAIAFYNQSCLLQT